MPKRKQTRHKHVPQRTCVACRQKTDKRRLTRIVRTPEQRVFVDPTGKQNGRGAYLCDQRACWERAISDIRILNRALMVEVDEADRAALSTHMPSGDQDRFGSFS